MSSKTIWLAKHGRGFMPADELADKVHMRLEPGEAIPFRPIKVRDIRAHRRYWLLMKMCADNCERIEVQPGAWMDIKTKDNVHTAVKLLTGHYDSIFDAETGVELLRIPKSTNFEEMTPEQWNEYWPMVCVAVKEKVMPGVSLIEVQVELDKLMGLRSEAA